MSTQKADTHVNNLLSSCWPTISSNRTVCQPEQFLLDDHKLMLEEHEIEMDSLQYDSDAEKGGIDVFDSLILSNQTLNTELAELKPLPPFTGYTGHLSINGISGHHYHAIAHRHISSEENNNFLVSNELILLAFSYATYYFQILFQCAFIDDKFKPAIVIFYTPHINKIYCWN